MLEWRVSDSFRRAGTGWGNTITNPFAFHRTDQIRLSLNLRPVRHSDHRLVVCDVMLQRPPLAVFAADVLLRFRAVGDLHASGIIVYLVPGAESDIAQQHHFG
ncbi:MAG: hypothetical protein KatS3mg022_2444 [Armatimonadota bacterium]|nr:MAG: hypothetical protein KatS3mg022_2444 [Armatimonadota bacterium]